MAKVNKLNVYFPINNLNPQGWISEFITPVVTKTGLNRSDMANIFYDPYISPENISNLEKINFSNEEIGDFISRRSSVDEDKMIFLNGNFLDVLEVDNTLRDSTLEEKELIAYTKFMSGIKPYQQAFLQPYIKLQYGYRTNKKEEYKWVDFPFTQYYNLDYILSAGKPRSEGAGISSVKVENQFNLATHINSKINISFIFGSMQILTQEMGENGVPVRREQNPFPFGFSFTKLVANLDTNKEIIRLEYGRKVAPGFDGVVDNQSLKDIIEKREKKVLLLSKISHDFNFDEKGVVEISVNYLNFHDEKMGKPTNVSVPSPSPKNVQTLNLPLTYGDLIINYNKLVKETKELEEKLQDVRKTEEAETIDKIKSEEKNVLISYLTERLTKSNKTLNQLKRSLKPSLTTVFLDQIKAQGQLFGINFNTIKVDKVFKIKSTIFLVSPNRKSDGDFKNLFSYETEYDVNSLLTSGKIPQNYKDNKKKLEEDLTRSYARIFNSPYDEKETNINKAYGHIMFFPLKALISAAYTFLDEDEKKEIPHMLFGNVLLKVSDKMCSINIGDLLVETSVFQKWYYEKFFVKDRLEYPFGVFLKDVMTDLVPEILYRNRVGFDDRAPTTAVKEIQYYLKSAPDEKLKQKLYTQNNKDDLKQFASLMSKIPNSNPIPLIYFGQLNNQTTQVPSPLFSNLGISEFNFNETKDAAKGIPYIKIGADGGFFTKINFKAQDFTKIRTALAMESLADKASRYFFFYYQIGIEMMGSNMFNYDSVVCVPSNPLGIDTEENDTGVAGYYKVKSVSDMIDSQNNYTSVAQADWVFNPKYLNREKQKINTAPGSDIIIRDFIDININNPENYIIELLEHDANSVINNQAQNIPKIPDKKVKEKAIKDKKQKKPETMRVDNYEKIPKSTISPINTKK